MYRRYCSINALRLNALQQVGHVHLAPQHTTAAHTSSSLKSTLSPRLHAPYPRKQSSYALSLFILPTQVSPPP